MMNIPQGEEEKYTPREQINLVVEKYAIFSTVNGFIIVSLA